MTAEEEVERSTNLLLRNQLVQKRTGLPKSDWTGSLVGFTTVCSQMLLTVNRHADFTACRHHVCVNSFDCSGGQSRRTCTVTSCEMFVYSIAHRPGKETEGLKQKIQVRKRFSEGLGLKRKRERRKKAERKSHWVFQAFVPA